MKIAVQEKIAELERRIVALESARSKQTTTTTTTSGPLTVMQDWHLKSMWSHFNAMMVDMGKVFK